MKINSFTMIYPNPFCDDWHKNMKTYIVTWDYVKKRKVKRNKNFKGIISIKPIE